MSTKRVTAPGASFVCSVLKHQVTGERCLNGNLGRFQIAHFPNHDDVRILTQKGAQRLAETSCPRLH